MSSESTVKPLIPVWLDKEFLEGILRNYYKNNGLSVIYFDVKSASGNGEGFMSSMYRTKVNFTVPMEAEKNQVIKRLLKISRKSSGTTLRKG